MGPRGALGSHAQCAQPTCHLRRSPGSLRLFPGVGVSDLGAALVVKEAGWGRRWQCDYLWHKIKPRFASATRSGGAEGSAQLPRRPALVPCVLEGRDPLGAVWPHPDSPHVGSCISRLPNGTAVLRVPKARPRITHPLPWFDSRGTSDRRCGRSWAEVGRRAGFSVSLWKRRAGSRLNRVVNQLL